MKLRLALLAMFLVRLGYGLSADFWTEDERQVFLIGLRSFARGEWPYFGADVVWTGSQLPGGLQGLLVGLPFRVWAAPEAPIVFLNLISFAALCFFAWYCERHVTHLPRWLIWGWFLTAPWTLNFSAHIVNTSYILPGSILAFVGFFEALPGFRRHVVPPALAFAMMGFGLFWLFQIHLSWVLLPPFAVVAFVLAARSEPKKARRFLGAFALGCLASGSVLIPTILKFGPAAVTVGRNIRLHLLDLGAPVTILARFLSFATFEIPRFLGLDTASRLAFLFRNPWLIPLAVLLGAAGIVQAVALAGLWFRRARSPEARTMNVIALVTVGWVYVSFFFSVRGPLAHSFYITFPVAMLYSVYCWDDLISRARRPARWRAAAAALLIAGVLFHVGVAAGRLGERSLYANRSLAAQAVAARDDRILGNRRLDSRGPWSDDASDRVVGARRAYARASAQQDIEVADASWSAVVLGKVSAFSVTLTNRSAATAYVDIQLTASYFDSAGRSVASTKITLKEVLQPGERHVWGRVVDGFVAPGTARANLRVLDAEKCVPSALAGVGMPRT